MFWLNLMLYFDQMQWYEVLLVLVMDLNSVVFLSKSLCESYTYMPESRNFASICRFKSTGALGHAESLFVHSSLGSILGCIKLIHVHTPHTKVIDPSSPNDKKSSKFPAAVVSSSSMIPMLWLWSVEAIPIVLRCCVNSCVWYVGRCASMLCWESVHTRRLPCNWKEITSYF